MTQASLEQMLLVAEYEIMYRVSASHAECLICHPDWVTSNPYAARVLPAGKGTTQDIALQNAVRSDKVMRERWL